MTELVILPGLDGTATLHSGFLAACDCFESGFAVRYPAHQALGYGELEGLARASLPRSAPFVLLGESFSGPIALSIAANPPANLIGVVLSTTFAASPFAVLSLLAPVARLAPVRALPLSLLSWWLLGNWTTADLEVGLGRALQSVSPSVLRFRIIAALEAVAPDLRAISVPVLYLRATQDRLLPASAGEHIRSRISHCELTDIVGPHLLLQATPRECAGAVTDFVQRLCRSGITG